MKTIAIEFEENGYRQRVEFSEVEMNQSTATNAIFLEMMYKALVGIKIIDHPEFKLDATQPD